VYYIWQHESTRNITDFSRSLQLEKKKKKTHSVVFCISQDISSH